MVKNLKVPKPKPRNKSQAKKKPIAAKPTGKSTQAAHETRQSLIKAAQMHFCKSGFQAASVHEIARDAGVNVSLVSYHFGNKAGLFKECIERAGVDRLAAAERVLASPSTSIEEFKVRLEVFIDEMLLDGINNPEVCTILYRDLHSEFHLIEDVFKTTFLKTFQLLVAFFDHAKRANIIAPWTEPQMSAVQITGAVIHFLKSDEIRKRLFKQSIADPAKRIETRNYIVKSHLEGIWNRN